MQYKKRFGQNFIGDVNLLASLARLAGITKGDEVLEIGAGVGALTKQLAAAAGKVVSYEIDRDLRERLLALNLGNTQFVFKDVMSEKDADIAAYFAKDFKIAANLPYYITTPIIFKFLDFEGSPRPSELNIMVQKEVGERLCAAAGTSGYGALTVSVQSRCDVKILKSVGRKMFFPVPEVDSVFVSIKIRNEGRTGDAASSTERGVLNLKTFRALVNCVFTARRKTLVNNLKNGFNLDRAAAEGLLQKMNIPPLARGETLTPAQFVELADYLV